MKTTDLVPPRAGVDSGTLLIIDPCFLRELLSLTPQQEDAWNARWLSIINGAGYETVAGMHVAGNATAIIVSCPEGDGIYTPEQVASFLVIKPEVPA